MEKTSNGHQLVTSLTTSTFKSSITPSSSTFSYNTIDRYDWVSNSVDTYGENKKKNLELTTEIRNAITLLLKGSKSVTFSDLYLSTSNYDFYDWREWNECKMYQTIIKTKIFLAFKLFTKISKFIHNLLTIFWYYSTCF